MNTFYVPFHKENATPMAWEGKEGFVLNLFSTSHLAHKYLYAFQLHDYYDLIAVGPSGLVNLVDDYESQITHFICDPDPKGGEIFTPNLYTLKAWALYQMGDLQGVRDTFQTHEGARR